MQVPFIDLPVLHRSIEDEIMDALKSVLQSGRYILGPVVQELEDAVAGDVGASCAVGVSSGTDALLAALMALDVGPGDKVITTAFSFVSTGEVIVRTGAEPVFVDIEEGGFNLDIEAVADVLSRDKEKKVKAVVPVHLYGRMADMKRLKEVVGDIPVIEDSAQSLGAEREGFRAGSAGTMACFSFFPTKNLGCLGDGGMVSTSSAELYDRLLMIRSHGGKTKSEHPIIGGNFRLDPIQAAVLSVKRPHLERWTRARRDNAAAYNKSLKNLGVPIELPPMDGKEETCVWNQYVILTKERDELRSFLAEQGIATAVYYEKPFHMEGCFSYLGHQEGDFPRAERAAAEGLALPVHPMLEKEKREYVIEGIANFFADK